MNIELFGKELKEINRRFISICLRMEEDALFEFSNQINCSMLILRMIRKLSFDQIESVLDTNIFLLQPSIEEKSLLKALSIESLEDRRLFLNSTVGQKNEFN